MLPGLPQGGSRMRKIVIAVAACAALSACKKDGNNSNAAPATPVDKEDTDKASDTAKAEPTDPAKAADPWASAPDSASTLGAGTGAGIAKLDLAADRAALRGDKSTGGAAAPVNH